MAQKCEICKKTIGTLFLGKIIGSFVKDEKGVKHLVCDECQSKLKTKKDILEKLS